MAVSRPPAREQTSSGSGGGPRGPKRQHRKVCTFCVEKIDYMPRRVTGTCARHQRPLTTALERARAIALLPYTTEQR